MPHNNFLGTLITLLDHVAFETAIFCFVSVQGELVRRFANGKKKIIGIEDFQIIGEAKPGNRLLGCGFPVRGTSLCLFQWVRHLQDGTRQYIQGATNPEYVVTADDVDKLIAVECIPMDDQGREVFYKPYFKDVVLLYNFSLELSACAEMRLSLKGAFRGAAAAFCQRSKQNYL
ncbi:hypothetical protein RHGRI_020577 [Rhododendron griersonianum]|uniref:AIR9-like A9 domain-containing protein n=1 Tax=Rhododendron griersonianum TaxID=479676 RepID=A0AAV6JK52_9ERIC|nr:hypothetical protein RHGRI_020577 [Rhododendron griersonianum]